MGAGDPEPDGLHREGHAGAIAPSAGVGDDAGLRAAALAGGLVIHCDRGAVTGDDPGNETGFGEFALPTPLREFTGTWEFTGAGPDACAVRIDVESKPMFVPCSAIGEHLDRRLRKAAATT